jgi:hypothetical protein
MLRRFWVHIWLVLVFAFVQAGIATHEISHLNNPPQQSQPDKSTSTDTACALCIAFAQGAHGVASHSFTTPLNTLNFDLATPYVAKPGFTLNALYSARGPPYTSS